MSKEELKEAAKIFTPLPLDSDMGSSMYNSFIAGAKWQESKSLEYRELLKKYMSGIMAIEGTPFIESIKDFEFTKQEIEELKRIEEEI
jgi:hypothetical protein